MWYQSATSVAFVPLPSSKDQECVKILLQMTYNNALEDMDKIRIGTYLSSSGPYKTPHREPRTICPRSTAPLNTFAAFPATTA